MKTWPVVLFGLIAGLATACAPVFAHHGGAIYDTRNLMTLKATITDFEFVNPHVQIHFDAKDDKGNVVHWACETLSPDRLVHGSGWSRDVLKPGDQVTIILYPAKAGTPVGNLKKVVFADGHELTTTENAPTH